MLLIEDIPKQQLLSLLQKFKLQLCLVSSQQKIPGSYWGEPEAGLISSSIYVRSDTPMQSFLHETCHYICMDDARRKNLHTDAGGRTPAEENAVCYLQILLSNTFPEMGRQRMFKDMDDWGYSFRLGSAQRWFEEDADDARQWLIQAQLIDKDGKILYHLRS